MTKTVTLHPREGNPPPRIAETPSGMVNSIGLANPGLERVRQETCPVLPSWAPHDRERGRLVAGRVRHGGRAVGAHPAVAAIELNVSCPNVESGCISIGTDPHETRALVERCRAETDVPCW